MKFSWGCFLFLFFLVLAGTPLQGQNAKIDSLRTILKNSKEDTNKIQTLNLLSEKLRRMGKYDTSMMDASLACALAEKLNYKTGTIVAYRNIGLTYACLGNYPEALKYDQKALSITIQLGDKQGSAIDFGNIANVYFDQGDYAMALKYDSSALIIDRKMNDKKGIDTHLGNIGNVYASLGNYSKALEYYVEAVAVSTEIADNDAVARNLGNMGIVYSSQGNYPKALECYFKTLAMNQKSGNKRDVTGDMINIGNLYEVQENYAKALEYYHNALAISEATGYKKGVGLCFSSIGGVYADRGNSDSALKYDEGALNIAREIGDKDGVGTGLCDLGNIYRTKGNIAKAMEYYFMALPVERETGNKNFMISAYANIGSGYLKQKNYKAAKVYLDSALNLSLEIGNKDDIQFIYVNMASLDSTMGNYPKALEDYKKYMVCRDSTINQETVKKITRLEVSFEYEKKADSVSAVQERENIIKAAEIKRKSIITDSALVIAILTAILAALLINRQQIKRKKDKLLFEKNLELSEQQKNILELEKKQTENELSNAQKLLDDYVKSLVEKNTLLEQFKEEIENLKRLKSKEIDEQRIEQLEILHKATILTEEDWDKFKIYFEQVYKGFFIRLKEKLPDLTQAEIRLVCLTKLKLDTKQMAGILAVSADTIRKTRYRLRKKLGLSEEDSLDEVVISI